LAAGEQAHRAALALSPDDDAVMNNLGFNLLQQNRPEEAIRILEAALRENRDNALARSNLARAMSARAAESDPSGAVAHWSVALDPASAHNNLAASFIERGDYAPARKELESALAIERSHLAAWNNLRLVSELDGKPVSAPATDNPGPWRRFTAFWKNAFRATPPGELKEGPSQRASQ
jgi:Flp pilus assembly protein TadD